MSFTISGDFPELKRWEKRLRRSPKALDVVSMQLSEETIELIRQGFAEETDPYGKPWAPLVLRSGRALSDTGGLRSSWHRTQLSAGGFSVASSKTYAAYHQNGTGIYGPRGKRIRPVTKKALAFKVGGKRHIFASVAGAPIRRMIPTTSGGLPSRWRESYVEIVNEVLTEHFSRGKR